MDIKKIKEVMDLFAESDLTAIEIAEKDTKIRLERDLSPTTVVSSIPSPVVLSQNETTPSPVIEEPSGKKVKSPLVGTYYAAGSPTDPPFVKVGQQVTEGEVLCIIEAMKVMNEIAAPFSGTVTKILAENGDVIAFDQPLFEID